MPSNQKEEKEFELSIVMPCLNEAETVGLCIEKSLAFLESAGVNGEIIVADNGSADGSQEIARRAGARVVHISEKGYGSAINGGVLAAKGKYIIMGDSDDSYDFLNLHPFLEKLRSGYALVMGNRFKGGLKPGAMPFLHRYVGNPALSGLGRLFFNKGIGDFHCGLRGFSKRAYFKMDMQTAGMEFASEMVVKATLYGLKITEVPTTLSPDGRTGRPHLRSFSDGWRHLKFLLVYSPRWLFLYPGLILMALGFIFAAMIISIPDMNLDIHTLLYSVAAIMIGFQAVIFAIFTKTFAVHQKLLPTNTKIESILSNLTIEKGLITGGALFLLGLAGSIYALLIWDTGDFFTLGITQTMRIVIASFTLLVLGFQIIFSSFFFNFLKINTQ